jgi:Response regulator containing CheY-like receiver, AAA-type ATPase, and DNA-binding domains
MENKIIVLDNSLIIQKALEIAFSAFDIQIHKANNFEELFQYYDQSNPDLLIININTLENLETINLNSKKLNSIKKSYVLILESSFLNINTSQFTQNKKIKFIKKPFTSKEIICFLEDKMQLKFKPKDESPVQKKTKTIHRKENTPQIKNYIQKDENNKTQSSIENHPNIDQDSLDDKISKVILKYCNDHLYRITKDIISNKLDELLKVKNNKIDL